MGKVTTGATMSIDGYIAGPNESGFDLLFQWYNAGDVEIRTGNPDLTFRTSAASAQHWKEVTSCTGALLVGRHLYDFVNGWDERHPMDVTTIVLTHRLPHDRPAADENFVFVTGGIEEAVEAAKKIAGDRNVGVNGGQMASQCLDAGLLDEISVDLVPVILGGGTPFFGGQAGPGRRADLGGRGHRRYPPLVPRTQGRVMEEQRVEAAGPAVTTWHLGAHDRLGQAYARLAAWRTENDREAAGPAWEVYHWVDLAVTGEPGPSPDPSTWRVQLVQPIN